MSVTYFREVFEVFAKHFMKPSLLVPGRAGDLQCSVSGSYPAPLSFLPRRCPFLEDIAAGHS